VTSRRRLTAPPLVLATLVAAPLHAQSVEALRERYRIPEPPPVEDRAVVYGAAPAISANTPVGFGAALGDVWGGVGIQLTTRFTVQPDALAGFGFGLGDARRFVGLDVDAISFSTVRHGIASRGGIDLKLHRQLGERSAIAVGVESAASRNVDHPPSWYAVGSRVVRLRARPGAAFGELTTSAGVGNGRFRTENDWLDGVKTFNVFGSAALRVVEPVSFITEWTGQDLAVNVSVVPLRRLPFVFTAGVVDATRRTGDGPRFIAATGMGLNLRGRR
jgi:hypothetical protein